ncbi:hypothetical protein [Natrinema hispanicum]|uniref:Uncharacterized protein n=1 Tax=Natrinema hispanicum TaxID=392421 RepID=A0A1I0E4C3_9EURY|nr:hypothetical protein [Natrinema hispanicum]SDC69266.1 hypothetical protein SAMN05192552_1006105 [Natrinema hispanicum]SET39719.1 hypothetical protein SAMN04488694_10690 [Natrinema hispanicum]
MFGSRTATAVVGLLVSLLVSAVLWWRFNTVAFFLVVPFVPFLFGKSGRESSEPPVRTCPACGFQTRDPAYEYCPRDGTALETTRARESPSA